jgi:hypothetical protein
MKSILYHYQQTFILEEQYDETAYIQLSKLGSKKDHLLTLGFYKFSSELFRY